MAGTKSSELLERISANTGRACYALASGLETAVRQPGGSDTGGAALTRNVMSSLHMASFGGLPMRWLYFVCGLAGTAMMGTGAILFLVKRRQKSLGEFGAATPRVYRLVALPEYRRDCRPVDRLHRLPVGQPPDPRRPGTACRAGKCGPFSASGVLTLLHACLRSEKRAWIEQLGLLAALCLLLPLLNLLTTGDHLAAQCARGDWESAGVELCAHRVWPAGRLGRLEGRHAQGKARRRSKESPACPMSTRSTTMENNA